MFVLYRYGISIIQSWTMNYSYKQIWLINAPVMMSILMEQLINITDAVFLGHVGETELGASALAAVYYLSVYMLGFGFSLGLQVMIARRNGEQNYEQTGRTFFQGMYFLSMLAFLLCLLIQGLSPSILKGLITSPDIYRAVIQYLDWRSYGLLFSFPVLALRAFLVGITNTKALTYAALAAVCVNIPLNYLFIFKLNWGITGAAAASSLAEAGALLILVFYVWWKIDSVKYGLKGSYDKRLLARLLNISLWSMFHSFISIVPWFLFFVAIEHLGKTELAISNIIRSVSALFFVIVNSFATTAGSLVSNLIGSGEGKRLFPVCRKVLLLGYGIGLPLVGAALLFRSGIIGFYTEDSGLLRQAMFPFVVALLNYIFALPGYVYINAVTGSGNTRTAFVFQVTTISCYLAYLFLLNSYSVGSLAVYMTAEYLYVILLGIQSLIYLRRNPSFP